MTTTEPSAFEQAKTDYFRAVNTFTPILEAEARAAIMRLSPDIVTVRLLGEYGDDMDRRLRIQDAFDAGGILIGSLDCGGPQRHQLGDDYWGDEHQVAFETACDEADPLFDWLLDLTGDDWMGEQLLNVVTGEIESVTA